MDAVMDSFFGHNAAPVQLSFLPKPVYINDDGSLNLAVVRKQLFRMDQEEFADLLGIPHGTYRSWEYKHRNPSGPSLSLLRIAVSRPDVVKEILGDFVQRTQKGSAVEEERVS